MAAECLFPVEEGEKTNETTNRLLLLVITELCLKLFSGDSRLLVNSLWINQRRKWVGGDCISGSLKKKKKARQANKTY